MANACLPASMRSIPAHAGETLPFRAGRDSVAVDPRSRGGDTIRYWIRWLV